MQRKRNAGVRQISVGSLRVLVHGPSGSPASQGVSHTCHPRSVAGALASCASPRSLPTVRGLLCRPYRACEFICGTYPGRCWVIILRPVGASEVDAACASEALAASSILQRSEVGVRAAPAVMPCSRSGAFACLAIELCRECSEVVAPWAQPRCEKRSGMDVPAQVVESGPNATASPVRALSARPRGSGLAL